MQSEYVMCQDFMVEVNYYLKKNYQLFKTLLLINKANYEKNKSKIDNIIATNNIQLIVLPKGMKNDYFALKLLQKFIQDDVKFIVGFVNSFESDIVKNFATQNSIKYMIAPMFCESSRHLLNYCYYYNEHNIISIKYVDSPSICLVDETLIMSSNNKQVAGCFGQIIACYLVIIDYMIERVLNNRVVDFNILKNVEKLLYEAISLPSNILITPCGKVKLFQIKLQIEILFRDIRYMGSSVESVAILINNFTKNKASMGESFMIASMFLSGIYCKFFSVESLNLNRLPSYAIRAKKVRNFLGSNDLELLTSYQNFDKLSKRFDTTKCLLKNLSYKYDKIIKAANFIFKNFYLDKAVFLNKLLSREIIFTSISLSPDVFFECSALKTIRDCGLLDFVM